MSGREVDMGGGGGGGGGRNQYSNIYVPNLKESFLPVKTSSFLHAKVWSPKTQ